MTIDNLLLASWNNNIVRLRVLHTFPPLPLPQLPLVTSYSLLQRWMTSILVNADKENQRIQSEIY